MTRRIKDALHPLRASAGSVLAFLREDRSGASPSLDLCVFQNLRELGPEIGNGIRGSPGKLGFCQGHP